PRAAAGGGRRRRLDQPGAGPPGGAVRGPRAVACGTRAVRDGRLHRPSRRPRRLRPGLRDRGVRARRRRDGVLRAGRRFAERRPAASGASTASTQRLPERRSTRMRAPGLAGWMRPLRTGPVAGRTRAARALVPPDVPPVAPSAAGAATGAEPPDGVVAGVAGV